MAVPAESREGLTARLAALRKEYERLFEFRRHSMISIAGLTRSLGAVVEREEGDETPETHRLTVDGEIMKAITGDERVYLSLDPETHVLTVEVRDQTDEEKKATEEANRPPSISRPTIVLPPGVKL